MSWKDKFIITIQKQRNLVCNSQTIYDEETINKEISFEDLVRGQTLIGQYAKNATEQEIAELIEKHGLELTNRSLMALLKTVRPLLIVSQQNPQLVKEIFDKNPELDNRFKGVYKNLVSSSSREKEDLSNERTSVQRLLEVGRTYETCLAAAKQDGSVLYHVPGEFMTTELCLAAVQQNGRALRYVPRELRTEEMCWAAVQQTGMALSSVPTNLKTSELCLAAVQGNGSAIYSVPLELRTEDIYLAAIQQDGTVLRYVPEELKTPDLCLAAVKQSGYALYYVPLGLKTEDICLTAVKQNCGSMKFMSEKQLTQKLCLAAVQQDGNALCYVPRKLKTLDLCLVAIRQNGKALYHVPLKLRTPELCWTAVEQNGVAVADVPPHLRTPEMYLAALQQTGAALEIIPADELTTEMCLVFANRTIPGSCKAFRKYFILQVKGGASRLHDFENSFFKDKKLLSEQNSKLYHWNSFFEKFLSNNAMELYKLFKKKKDLVDYQVDRIENIDALSSDGIDNLYSTYIFPIKQSELLKNIPEKMRGYIKTIEYLIDEGTINANKLVELFEKIPSKSEVKDKHPVLKHRIMEINGFKFEILEKSDETGLLLGHLTRCCQRLDGLNSDAVYDGFLNPKSNFLAVYYGDRLIAQSWLRLGKSNVLYLDNIESNSPFSVNYKGNFNNEKYELLKASFIEFAKFMKGKYDLANVVVGKAHSDVTFDKLLKPTPFVAEDFVGEEKLETDLEDEKNYILARKWRSEMKTIRLSKKEWDTIGKKAGFYLLLKTSQTKPSTDERELTLEKIRLILGPTTRYIDVLNFYLKKSRDSKDNRILNINNARRKGIKKATKIKEKAAALYDIVLKEYSELSDEEKAKLNEEIESLKKEFDSLNALIGK